MKQAGHHSGGPRVGGPGGSRVPVTQVSMGPWSGARPESKMAISGTGHTLSLLEPQCPQPPRWGRSWPDPRALTRNTILSHRGYSYSYPMFLSWNHLNCRPDTEENHRRARGRVGKTGLFTNNILPRTLLHAVVGALAALPLYRGKSEQLKKSQTHLSSDLATPHLELVCRCPST